VLAKRICPLNCNAKMSHGYQGDFSMSQRNDSAFIWWQMVIKGALVWLKPLAL